MADKVAATFHHPPKTVRMFFQVFEEDKEHEGEYIQYASQYSNEADLLEFIDKVYFDLNQRVAFLGRNKSMLTSEVSDDG